MVNDTSLAGSSPGTDAELQERLAEGVQLRALLCVTATDSMLAAEAVDRELALLGDAAPVVVTHAASRTRNAFVDAWYTALHLDRHRARPRYVNDALSAIGAELTRRSSPVIVLHGAELWRAEALECLYGTWNAAPARSFTAVLTGSARLKAVLQRPNLASLNNCLFTSYHLGEHGS